MKFVQNEIIKNKEEKIYMELIGACSGSANIERIKKYITPENANGLLTIYPDVTPLMNACYSLEPEAVELVLKSGADPNKKVARPSGFEGETTDFTIAIFNAIDDLTQAYAGGFDIEDHITILKLLIEYSADVNIRDCDGITPLDFIIGRGMDDIENYLRSLGAKTSEELTEPYKINLITSKELNEVIKSNKKILIIDVTDKIKFDSYRIKNSISKPYTEYFNYSNMYGIDFDEELILYSEYWHYLAYDCAEKLTKLGYKNIQLLKEGFNFWKENNYPCEGTNELELIKIKFKGQIKYLNGFPFSNQLIEFNLGFNTYEFAKTNANGNYEVVLFPYKSMDKDAVIVSISSKKNGRKFFDIIIEKDKEYQFDFFIEN